jgi:hypothetical protein
MAYQSNKDKVLQAVLLDENLMKFGNYSELDIKSIYQAADSENIVIATTAKIILRESEGASLNEIYNEISNYLKMNV